MSSSQKCYFHPEVDAVDTCERCHKLICLADKRTYTYQSSGLGSRGRYYNSYAVKYTYCPPCYFEAFQTGVERYNRMRKVILPFMAVFIIPFILVPLFMITSFMNSPFGNNGGFSGVFLFFPIIFIVIVLIIFVGIFKSQTFMGNKIKEEYGSMREDKANFYGEKISSNSDYHQNPQEKLHCYKCGTYITKKDKFCPECGDSTKEELGTYN